MTATAGPDYKTITVSSSVPSDGRTLVYASNDGTNFSLLVGFPWYDGSNSYTWRGLDTNKIYYFKATTQSGTRQRESGIVSVALGADQDAGTASCPMIVGHPVNVTNGNMYLQQTDYNLPGIGESINITRTYNGIIQASGWFGYGWSTQYDENVIQQSSNSLRLGLANGRAVYFGRTSPTVSFTPAAPDFYGSIVKNADNTFTLTFKDGRVHQFNAVGRLRFGAFIYCDGCRQQNYHLRLRRQSQNYERQKRH